MSTSKKRPSGADQVPVKVPAGRALLADGTIVNWPEEIIYVPRDVAEEHQATTELLAALQAGAPITLADWHRFATSPPMTGHRLFVTIARLSRLGAAQLAKIKEKLRPFEQARRPESRKTVHIRQLLAEHPELAHKPGALYKLRDQSIIEKMHDGTWRNKVAQLVDGDGHGRSAKEKAGTVTHQK